MRNISERYPIKALKGLFKIDPLNHNNQELHLNNYIMEFRIVEY